MTNAPFGDCKTAELHLINRVQSFGGLIAIDKRTHLMRACSENIQQFSGKTPDQLLGQHFSTMFRVDQVPSVFSDPDAAGQQLPLIKQAELGGHMMLIASHSVGNTTLVEIERRQSEDHRLEFADRVDYLHALAGTPTPEAAAGLLMKIVARITQYDSVMLYKFLPDWHGEVIAERLKPGVPGFLGLRFPATDVPANVRRLCLINWQRVIADVHADTIGIITQPGYEAIDFSYSQLRAVHPVHIQYLKNMGVEASFSVSIVAGGQLWGMVACHHLTPKCLSLDQRQLCEEMARITNIQMTAMNALRLEQSRAGLREGTAAILGALRSLKGDGRSIVTQLAPMRQLFRAQGLLAHLDHQDFHSGEIPDDVSLSALRNSLEKFDNSAVAARNSIDPAHAKYPALVRFASGILYIPLPGRDFLLLMRPEQVVTVSWAGRPQSYSDAPDGLAEFSPRASYEIWSEQVHGSAEQWTPPEIESAARLRELLTDHIGKHQLEMIAMHDPLTGLANRLMFERALQEAIKLAIKDGMLAAVFILDLDRFKAVNDTLGHAAGDELLIAVGSRLKALMRSRDVVARLGGDEFGIVGFDLRAIEDSNRTAVRIIEAVRQPFIIHGHSIEIGVSIGVSMCPLHATEPTELLENADLALYQAKGAGRNTFKSFTHDMLSDADQRESVHRILLEAMSNGSLYFAYQPIVNTKTKTLQSFEAFARWRHPVRDELSAQYFMPLVEQCHLLAQFAEWGIRQVLQQGKLWRRKVLPPVPVTVNLSAQQFLSLDLVGLCGSFSRELDVSLEWLRFDLDENALQVDFPRAAEKIAALSLLGVLINVDRFGQGLVPLNRLCDVKISQLKLTGKHFAATTDINKSEAIVAIIREVGRVLHVPIVATQVETDLMAARATAAGIEYLQGRLISHELNPDAAEGWLRHRIDPKLQGEQSTPSQTPQAQ